MRHCYGFGEKPHKLKICRICGKPFEAKTPRAKYCSSAECRTVLYERKKSRIYARRENLKLKGKQ